MTTTEEKQMKVHGWFDPNKRVLIPQKEYARLNGWRISQVAHWRRDRTILEWVKLPNGRIMIPADAETRFTFSETFSPKREIMREFSHLRIYYYSRYVDYRQALREVLGSTLVWESRTSEDYETKPGRM